jgi:hypothetical protein
VLLIYKEGQRDSAEKPSKMRLDTIRGGPKGLRADIGSLKRFRLHRLWLAKKLL